MCTSIAMRSDGLYFGRNLDLEYSFGERVVIAPRNFPFVFRRAGAVKRHYAMVGMAAVQDGYPLYAEAANEQGLCIAGLNFPGYAHYPENAEEGKCAVSPFELPLWLLGQCASVEEARGLLGKTCLVRIDFRADMPLTPLHWHIADQRESVVLECTREGMRIYDNPVGVMTNSPQFDFHLTNLRQYLSLTREYPDSRFHAGLPLEPFGVGMGAVGLPGDFSPVSRFVKAAFLNLNSVDGGGEEGRVSRFFHLLDAVAMPDGIVQTRDGRFERTSYSCLYSGEEHAFYYKTYESSRLKAVSLKRTDLTGSALIEYPVVREAGVQWLN